MIYTFSGTGNSEYVARRIAAVTGDKITSLSNLIKHGVTTAVPSDTLVFCVPTYAWRIPGVVGDWIRKADLTHGAKAWFVMTCGSQIGDAPAFNERLCKEKGLTYMGTTQIIMPENYIALFSAPEAEQAKNIIARANPIINQAAQCIREEKPIPSSGRTIIGRAMSAINPIFYKTVVKDKAFTVSTACISCSLCVKVCPLNNISMESGRPKWNGNCTHCMACITGYPVSAIEYGSKSIGQPRYHCPI